MTYLLCITCRETYDLAPLNYEFLGAHVHVPHVCPGPPKPTILHPVPAESEFLRRQRQTLRDQAAHGRAYVVPPAFDRDAIIAKFGWRPRGARHEPRPRLDDVVETITPPDVPPRCLVYHWCARKPGHGGHCARPDPRPTLDDGHDIPDEHDRIHVEPTRARGAKSSRVRVEPALPGPGGCWRGGMCATIPYSRFPEDVSSNFCRASDPRVGRWVCTRTKGTCDGLHVAHDHSSSVLAIWRDPAPEADVPRLFGREPTGTTPSGNKTWDGDDHLGVYFAAPGWPVGTYSGTGYTHATRAEAESALLERACEDVAVLRAVSALGVQFAWASILNGAPVTGATWTDENGKPCRWERGA